MNTLLSNDVYTPSWIIREGFIERLQTIPIFQSVKLWARNPGRGQYQPENIPLIAVYRLEENLSPDGDPNHGEPRFTHDFKLGFQVVVQNNDNVAAEASLNTAVWAIIRSLERQDWHSFACTGAWNGFDRLGGSHKIEIESVTRGQIQKPNFGPKTQQNEWPYAEQTFDMTFRYRSGFPPIVPDWLDLVHVTVAYPWPYDPTANEGFYASWDLRTDDGMPVNPIAPPVWPGMFGVRHYSLGSPEFGSPTISVTP